MSAKRSRKSALSASPPPGAAAMPAAGMTEVTQPTPAWIESNDVRKRLIGKIVLAGVWLYVAALWLLALDQLLNWGIFGPKVPPVP